MTTNPDLYPPQFHHYLTRNLTYVLGLVQGAGPVLDDELRGQALHTLRYALQASAVWPLTRDLCLTLAPKMEQSGQREHWIPYLQATLHQSEVQDDGVTAGECHLHLALLYRLLSNFAAAHEHLQAALAHFTALDARRDQARVLNELAWLEHLQYSYNDASHHVKQAIALLEPDDSERAMSYRVQGMLAISHQNWEEAQQFHRSALELFEKHQDQRKIAWSLQNLAYTFHQQKKYSNAFTLYEKAATALWQLGDKHNFAIVMHNIGYNHAACNEWQQALTYYKQAESIYKHLSDHLRLAKLHTDFGLAYFNLQDYTNAELSFTKSAKFFAALGDESWRLNAMDGLAMTHLAQKDYNSAYKVIKEALQSLSNARRILNYDYLHRSLNHHWMETIKALYATVPSRYTSSGENRYLDELSCRIEVNPSQHP